jgi:membrane protease YdiL (CAAX protease family)
VDVCRASTGSATQSWGCCSSRTSLLQVGRRPQSQLLAGKSLRCLSLGNTQDVWLPGFQQVKLKTLDRLRPAGALLRNSGSGLYWLATLQWGLFFIPTVVWAAQNRWRLRPLLLGPKPVPGPLVLLLAALLGVGIYFACTAAIAAKSGVSITDLGSTSLTGQTPPAPLPVPSVDGAVPGTSQQPQSLLQALGAGRPGDLDLTSWGRLWAVAALSPSVCEELLFRGFLLQALQRPRGAGRCLRSSGQASHSPSPSEPGSEEGPSLGRIDAIFVTGRCQCCLPGARLHRCTCDSSPVEKAAAMPV